MTSVLVAGIGNIFHGDDAFGVEVARKLAAAPLPPNVQVRDFGIRGIDLAFALLNEPDLTILVDAVARGGEPGTVYTIEPDLSTLDADPLEAVNSHSLDPAMVLRLAKQMGARFRRVLLVGCEPETLGGEPDGQIGLSDAVAAAVAPAAATVLALLESEVEDENVSADRNDSRVGAGSRRAAQLPGHPALSEDRNDVDARTVHRAQHH